MDTHKTLKLWDNFLLNDKIKEILDEEYAMYIEFEKKLYGVQEEDRIIFAQMKSSLREDKKETKEAYFVAYSLDNKENSIVIKKSDLNKINVLDVKKVNIFLKDKIAKK